MGNYLRSGLKTNGTKKSYMIHQLVAMAFLNHKPNGLNLVVDHINNIKTDNRLENLQIVTVRHNSTKDPRGVSKYPGVGWYGKYKKWRARVVVNGKSKFLGYFTNEEEASLAYQKALALIDK
jgi:hypothetical protein